MGVRAVFTIEDTNGSKTSPPRLFHAPWASPEFQIPHLADFYTWTVEHQQPLNLATYLRYAAGHPGTLPADEVTGSEFANENYRGDLDYRYRLTLAEDEHGLHLVVRAMRNAYMQPKPIVIETLNQASLYDAAARMCELVAARAQQYADRNDGVPMPGADPQQWAERAHSYRQKQQQQQFPVAAAGANLTAQFLPATFDGS